MMICRTNERSANALALKCGKREEKRDVAFFANLKHAHETVTVLCDEGCGTCFVTQAYLLSAGKRLENLYSFSCHRSGDHFAKYREHEV